MKRLSIILVLFIASVAQAATAVYATLLDSAKRNGSTVTVHWHSTKDGVTFLDRTVQYTLIPGETLGQFQSRIVSSERAVRDNAIESQKAIDLTESSNSDVSAALNGITQ